MFPNTQDIDSAIRRRLIKSTNKFVSKYKNLSHWKQTNLYFFEK